MKKALILSKMYINSLYGFSGFTSNIKKNKKSAAKSIALVLLILFSISGFVSMFVVLNIQLFNVLKPINQQGIVITNTIIFAVLFTFIFGFMGVLTTYFMDKEGDIILSMPLKPWEIFFSKFVTNYIYEAIVALLMMSTGFIIYGIKNDEGILFYIVSVIVSLLIPIIPLSINYFILIPLMKVGNILKKKDAVMMISGIIGMAFAVGIQGITQSLSKSIQNPEVLAQILASPNGLVNIAGKVYFPSILGTHAIINSTSISGVLNLTVFIGLTGAIFTGLISLMSQIYIDSLIGSGETKKINKKYSDKELKIKYSQHNRYYAMVQREIKLMNREPVHFLNGPMIIVILPLILGAVIFFQGNINGMQINSMLSMPNVEHYLTLGVAAISVFIGVSTNITSSCISREGKAFMHIKSMPINPLELINAKITHGILFSALASLIMICIGVILLKMPFINAIFSFVISQVISFPILLSGIFVELKWPKLDWDNPVKAMKQNLNVIIIMFGQMFIIAITGLIIFKLFKFSLYLYFGLIAGFLIISVLSYIFLKSYVSRRYYEIEV